MPGYFITLEGIEGAGKSTVIKKISEWLTNNNIDHIFTREPGGTVGSEAIRHVLLSTDYPLCPETELFLIQAARAQLMQEVILPALEQNKTVLLDRHTDSTLAYQGYGRGLDIDEIKTLNNFATRSRKPDLTIVLDLDVKLGLERSKKVSITPDRFESEAIEFMQKVREGFLDLANKEPNRIKVISAEQELVGVCQNALKIVKDFISTKLNRNIE